jgi:tRNA threonylcarbamoyladenosine biosynthesis protein TsaE
MVSTEGRADVPNLPWKRSAFVYSLAYGVGFIGASVAASLAGALIHGQHPIGVVLATPFVILCLPVSLFGLWRLLADTPSLQRWWVRRIAAGKSWRYVLLVAVATGGMAGVAFGVLAWASLGREKKWGWLPLVPLFLGPILGVIWLSLFKPLRMQDPDYDDNMSNVPSKPHATAITLENVTATESFGRRLGGLLFPNAVVALIGPLGAGKTQLSRAIAEGLGIANSAAVTSPTFTLIHEYPARLPIYHFDAYRLNGPNEFLDLGVTEYFEAGGVCLIEWADKVESALPAERLTIRIEVVDENRRRVEIDARGDAYQKLKAEKWWTEK